MAAVKCDRELKAIPFESGRLYDILHAFKFIQRIDNQIKTLKTQTGHWAAVMGVKYKGDEVKQEMNIFKSIFFFNDATWNKIYIFITQCTPETLK